jgi:N-acetylglutamate synthase-like GNAT family acetyltransferase
MSKTKTAAMKIRRMTRDDIDAVLTLAQKVGGNQRYLSSRDLNAMNPGESLDMSFVAQDKDKIVGFVKARLEYMFVPVTEVCLIHTTVVDPDYRKRGIGSLLIHELIDSCILNEINTIRALVDDGNNEQKSFAEDMGFYRSKISNYDKTINEI